MHQAKQSYVGAATRREWQPSCNTKHSPKSFAPRRGSYTNAPVDALCRSCAPQRMVAIPQYRTNTQKLRLDASLLHEALVITTNPKTR